MQPLFLKIFYRGSLLKTKPFTDDQISIGSGEGLNLQLEGLSPWHALIEKKLDRYFVFDLGSEEGTFIDEQRITGEAELVSGTKLKLGEYEIHFFIGAEKIQNQKKTATASFKKTESDASHKPKTVNPSSPDKPQTPKTVKPSSLADIQSSIKNSRSSEAIAQIGSYQKPDKKGYWKTFAPSSKIKNLDEYLQPSIGNLISITVAWKERILFSKHFYKNDSIYMGSGEDCQIKIPNMLGSKKYKLVTIQGGAKIHLNSHFQSALIQGKDKSTRKVTELVNIGDVNIKPYEIVKISLDNNVQIYIGTVKKQNKAPFVGLLNFSFSEMVSFFLATALTGLLIFYAGFYAPTFLIKKDNFLEKNIRVAKVIFQKRKTKVVELKLGTKNQAPKKAKTKKIVKKKKRTLRIPIKRAKKRQTKKTNIPSRIKSPGKMAALSSGKKKRTKKVTVGSARPGGSLKTGKAGSSAKTVAPDPNKMGLLGAFGGGGSLKRLDKGASGSGGLVGLARDSKGYAGTAEAYGGDGVGKKTKELASGGKGTSLVGISGYKTKGRGTGTSGTGTLGSRTGMSIEFSTDDIDVEGEIDRAGILKIIRNNRLKFDHCYQFSLQQQPSAQGSLKMQWDILPNGMARAVSAIDDQVGSKRLSACVGNILKTLNFPAPPSGQVPRVAFKFLFSI